MERKRNVLVLSDEPLVQDQRVQACISAYREHGWNVRFLNIADLQFASILSARLPLGLFLNWMSMVFRLVPSVTWLMRRCHIWKYRLWVIREPVGVLRDIVLPSMRAGQLLTRQDLLSDLDRIHANDLKALASACVIGENNKNLKITYDAHEFSPNRNRKKQSALSILMISAFESVAVDRCDRVIGVSSPSLAWVRFLHTKMTKHKRKRIWRLCSNNFFTYEENQCSKNATLAEGDGKNDISIIYIGALSSGRGLERLRGIADKSKELQIFIYCPEDSSASHERANIFDGTDNIHLRFGDYLERLKSDIKYIDRVFGWLWLEDCCLSYRWAMPNKIFQYSALQIEPILPPDMYVSKIARKFGIGHFIDLDVDLIRELTNCKAVDEETIKKFYDYYRSRTYSGRPELFG